MSEPKEVSVLTADDIVKYRDRSKDGKRLCLWQHAVNEFGYHTPLYHGVMFLFCEVAGGISGSTIPDVMAFNDSRQHSKSLIARVWNHAIYRLGYTVNNSAGRRNPLTERVNGDGQKI